ncbi:MAG TPA: PAS domain-containing sensor histidine kinase [Deltaproteobacteria bacterium]|nr:PAS domain-containing sensor histidine kinase [Deltaproteobacteria bacterium]
MKDEHKTKSQLIDEISSLRSEIEDLRESTQRYLQIEEELTHSENFYRTLFENSGTATIVIEEDTTISMMNSDFANFTGYSRDEIIGHTWTRYVAEDDVPRLLEYHAKRRQDPAAAPRNYEFKIRNKDGGLLHVYMTIAMIPGTTQSIASMVDITAIKQLEKEVLDISERERQKIGYELHDDLGQHLIGIDVMAKVLRTKLESISPEEARYASEINLLVKEAIEKTRRLARGLCPVHLTSHGLESSLEELAASTSNIFSISCTFNCPRHIPIGDNTLATHLYYIAKESIHNAIEHGKSTKIWIELLNNSGNISLSVLDNGIGIKDTSRATGIGLRIMNYRARMIGASLRIESDPGSGTLVTCTFNQERDRAHADR